ncbi:ABC transporter ATP-binding protein/permease [Tissierella pigra]|uniref:ABC transporter ATP-binding protein n=1 Tax=Tissierella pigra TaxID=2607614 RepID=A0A6N7XSB1_9FIRM|nr:ABC transporter ATP-binding protein [Tissierella pigra]MBU5425992.1 ABC transporter ATP-binding protein/permease [Tissierella pigra]MSU00647.1 ABC transporter ATP-binding protein [Tissierella pigra]
MFKLAVFLKPYKKECIIGPAFKLLEAILELLLPTIIALIINNGVANHDTNYVLKMGGLMLLMAILGFCSSMICQYYAARASQGFGTTLRNTLFKHISSFSHSEIDTFGTSSLINRITNDVNQLQLAVAMLIRLVIRAPFICIGAIIMAMILDFKLSLIFLAVTPIFAIILYFVISKSSPLYRKYQKKLDKMGLILRENLSGVRVIRAFARTKNEKQRFYAANDDLTESAINVGKISALLNPMTSFVMNVAIIAILWVAGFHVNTGRLSHGEIIAFVNYITQILLALMVVSNLVIIFTRASASADRINELLAITTSIKDNTEFLTNIVNNNTPSIQFTDVSFAYNNTGDMALENISITIHPGETIGLIGSTGSGKSTFTNLIPRFYDATKGNIFVDGINVKDYKLNELRNKIGIVPQNAVLFTGTIAENIRWGKQNATDEEIIIAAKIAQADEFISKLPDGYNTQVSRGGLNFSGGQKQRLTIARAVVSKPDILILDDSASALDFATDAALRKAINDISKNMTVIIVSQRVNTIKEVDKIIVLDNKHIVGTGTHKELMDNCKVYKEICLSQFSNEEASI